MRNPLDRSTTSLNFKSIAKKFFVFPVIKEKKTMASILSSSLVAYPLPSKGHSTTHLMDLPVQSILANTSSLTSTSASTSSTSNRTSKAIDTLTSFPSSPTTSTMSSLPPLEHVPRSYEESSFTAACTLFRLADGKRENYYYKFGKEIGWYL
ncbi:hypothetical protein HMI54_001008 [Coelomomyces lativittatus]|nr:hypothetical protein HMI55_001824 [Coelomomyces lativittatus]KAJ1511148.1 hypothetical protein HMI54_001008 [Coelomomyces lativittatus]